MKNLFKEHPVPIALVLTLTSVFLWSIFFGSQWVLVRGGTADVVYRLNVRTGETWSTVTRPTVGGSQSRQWRRVGEEK